MGFEPEWEEWAYRVSAEIWEAVTLAHDVEPSRLPVEWRPLDDSDPFEEWPQLARDIRIATDHAGRKLKCVYFPGNPARHKVDLSDFAEWWTESLGRKLPVRFPRHIKNAPLEGREPAVLPEPAAIDATVPPNENSPDTRQKVPQRDVQAAALQIVNSAEFQRGNGTRSERLQAALRVKFPNANTGTLETYSHGTFKRAAAMSRQAVNKTEAR
jgi:hypothetical protein